MTFWDGGNFQIPVYLSKLALFEFFLFEHYATKIWSAMLFDNLKSQMSEPPQLNYFIQVFKEDATAA